MNGHKNTVCKDISLITDQHYKQRMIKLHKKYNFGGSEPVEYAKRVNLSKSIEIAPGIEEFKDK